MYTSLLLFRNELKNNKIPLYKTIGFFSVLLLSKEIFPCDAMIKRFLMEVLGLSYKEYVFRSRTLLCAQVTRDLINGKVVKDYKRKLYKFLETQIEALKKRDNIKENNKLNGWI